MSTQLGIKKAKRDSKAKSEPWSKRRIEGSIKELNRDINLLTRNKNGEVKSKRKVKKLYEKLRIYQQDLVTVVEKLKQSFSKSSKVRALR